MADDISSNAAPDPMALGPIGGNDPSFDALLREFEVSTAPKDAPTDSPHESSPDGDSTQNAAPSEPVAEQPNWTSSQDMYDFMSNLAGSYGQIESERLQEVAQRDYKAEVDRL